MLHIVWKLFRHWWSTYCSRKYYATCVLKNSDNISKIFYVLFWSIELLLLSSSMVKPVSWNTWRRTYAVTVKFVIAHTNIVIHCVRIKSRESNILTRISLLEQSAPRQPLQNSKQRRPYFLHVHVFVPHGFLAVVWKQTSYYCSLFIRKEYQILQF